MSDLGVQELEPIPAGDNPFWHDLIRMGAHIRTWTDDRGRHDLYALYNSVDSNYPQTQRYARVLDLYDTSTGRRWRLVLPAD